MSNIYIQEPPTHGKLLLETSVGDIDIELWSREAPKACRNFVQLCMEGYYDGTIFHRVVKEFIAQGGDPTGTGTGGESIYGQPFKDEFHSRLRFTRRGLVAMANAGRDDNGSQFFFTLGPCPELQNKHTLFGKVSGNTLFNMLNLEEGEIDENERPVYPHKIIRATILSNPFPDIVPRVVPSEKDKKEDKKDRVKRKGTKNFKLLSFGEEAEVDEEDLTEVNKKFSGKSKSSHDLTDDPKLSALPAVEQTSSGDEKDTAEDKKKKHSYEKEESNWKDDEGDSERLERIRKKLKTEDDSLKKTQENEEEEENYESLYEKEKREDLEKRAKEIRREIRNLKRDMQSSKTKDEDNAMSDEDSNVEPENIAVQKYREEIQKYQEVKKQQPKKGLTREQMTLAMLSKFQKKLETAKEKVPEDEEGAVVHPEKKEEGEEEDENDEGWLTHTLKFDSSDPILAKDASMKEDDWFEIYDPRNPITKRRREASKKAMEAKDK